MKSEIDAVGPLNVLHHRARLPPAEALDAVEVRQVLRRMSLVPATVVADVARLRRPRDARLLAEVLLSSHSARVRRFDGQVESGVDERRKAPLRPAAAVVARHPAGVRIHRSNDDDQHDNEDERQGTFLPTTRPRPSPLRHSPPPAEDGV